MSERLSVGFHRWNAGLASLDNCPDSVRLLVSPIARALQTKKRGSSEPRPLNIEHRWSGLCARGAEVLAGDEAGEIARGDFEPDEPFGFGGAADDGDRRAGFKLAERIALGGGRGPDVERTV